MSVQALADAVLRKGVLKSKLFTASLSPKGELLARRMSHSSAHNVQGCLLMHWPIGNTFSRTPLERICLPRAPNAFTAPRRYSSWSNFSLDCWNNPVPNCWWAGLLVTASFLACKFWFLKSLCLELVHRRFICSGCGEAVSSLFCTGTGKGWLADYLYWAFFLTAGDNLFLNWLPFLPYFKVASVFLGLWSLAIFRICMRNVLLIW